MARKQKKSQRGSSMKKSNFYFRYRNVGVLPCFLSIFLVHYIVAKSLDHFGIVLVKMSNILIAETLLWIVFVAYFVIELWFVVQLEKEFFRARFAIDRTDPQVVFKRFFGKLVIELFEKRRGKNDCKKL